MTTMTMKETFSEVLNENHSSDSSFLLHFLDVANDAFDCPEDYDITERETRLMADQILEMILRASSFGSEGKREAMPKFNGFWTVVSMSLMDTMYEQDGDDISLLAPRGYGRESWSEDFTLFMDTLESAIAGGVVVMIETWLAGVPAEYIIA